MGESVIDKSENLEVTEGLIGLINSLKGCKKSVNFVREVSFIVCSHVVFHSTSKVQTSDHAV